tara:strand:+ start:28 stop:345 length:318 start_codon:yes stop_codon:yes gene_type:complete
MNEQFFDQNINIYTDIPVKSQPDIPTTTGKINMEYNKGKAYTELKPAEPDKTDITKLDYVNPEYLEPTTMYMNWHKNNPQGQWGPMKSENKMLSYERKNKINTNV